MSGFELLKWAHLIAASVWTGGMIVLAVLMMGVRKAGSDIDTIRALARSFALVSWIAMATALVTGVALFTDLGLDWASFSLKGTLIALSIGLAIWHQLTAKRMSPAARGIGQTVILVLAIAIFGAAVILV